LDAVQPQFGGSILDKNGKRRSTRRQYRGVAEYKKLFTRPAPAPPTMMGGARKVSSKVWRQLQTGRSAPPTMNPASKVAGKRII